MYKQRNRILFLILISMSVTVCSRAQDTLSERNSLKAGVWALQFGISSNFTLTSFQGSTFSIKYQLSDKAAIRGGISISGSTNSGNGTASGKNADTSIGSFPANSSSSSQGISFILQYLWYMNPSGPIHFFIGLGPSVSYSYLQSNTKNAYDDETYMQVYTQSSSSTQWGTGATGSVGIEWFPSQWFSLRAEYGESLQYKWGSNTSMTDYFFTNTGPVPFHYENSGTSKGWSLSISSVSFGLNVYW
jgi:hypothetical protein